MRSKYNIFKLYFKKSKKVKNKFNNIKSLRNLNKNVFNYF